MLRPLALGLSLFVCLLALKPAISAQGEPQKKDFLILNDDGYGTSDCLTKPSACGKIVADAWCESKGFARSFSYRPAVAEDATASAVSFRSTRKDAFVISCAE